MKKLISILLVFILLFSFCIVSYADDGNINTIDMEFVALSYNAPDPDLSSTTYDVTSQTEVSVFTVGGVKYGMIQYKLPLNDFSTKRLVATLVLSDSFSFNSNHEYNLKFDYSAYYQLPLSCVVQLLYYDIDNNLIKEQVIFNKSIESNKASNVHSVDIDFKPDVSDIESGYKCELSIGLVQNQSPNTNYQQSFFLSPQIELVDKDSNDSWFQKIINKINDVWESIKTLPEKIGVYISDIGNNIADKLKELFIPSDDYFSNYFQSFLDLWEEKLGFLAYPFTLFIDLLELYENIGNGSGILHLKEFKINGEVFLQERDINLKQLINDFNAALYNDCGIDFYKIYLAFVDVIILFGLVRLTKRKYAHMVDSGAFEGQQNNDIQSKGADSSDN